MIKNGITIFLILTFAVVGIFSCRKYPEDPFISLRTARKRILGFWQLERLTINGIDSTDHFKEFTSCGCVLDFWEGSYDSHTMGFGHCSYPPFHPCEIIYDLLDSEFPGRNLYIPGKIVYPFTSSWIKCPILKLYKDELKFRAIHPDNNKEYIFEYKKFDT